MATKMVPGPREFPWWGSVNKIIADAPQFFVELAQEYGEMARFSLVGYRAMLVSSPALIREVLVERADEFYKSPRDLALLSPYLGKGILTNDGPSHRQHRKLVQPAFHHKRIQGYAEVMVQYTREMIAKWRDGEQRNLSDELMQLTLFIVAKSLFNEDATRMADIAGKIGHAMDEMQEIVDKDFEAPWLPPLSWPTPGNRRRRATRDTFHAVVDELIANRVANTAHGAGNGEVADRGDLLSMLLLSKDENGAGLTHAEVRDEAITILLAGHETTANALSWSWYLLGKHPEVAAKLFAEVDAVLGQRAATLTDLPNLPYTAQVVKEAIRLYPPAWMLNARRVAQDTTIGGYAVARGIDLMISPYVMHRLPQFYDAPDEFRPERFTPEFEASLPRFAYMPFGGGPHICIGNSFAMMEAQLILATVSQRFALTLADAQHGAQAIQYNPQITLSIKGGLNVRVTARVQESSVSPSPLPQPELSQPQLSRVA